jgi:superfamily II DNA helicase RecQ
MFDNIIINLQVRTKASSQEECLQVVEDLLKTRYRSQSGIIYTTSIKDCEQLMHGLRNRKLRVGCYHANLEATLRSKVHAKWLNGEYQVRLLLVHPISFMCYTINAESGLSSSAHVVLHS